MLEIEDEDAVGEPIEQAEISLHALTGIRASHTMQLQVQVAGQTLLALVDSGSTHNFIAEGTARRLGLPLALHKDLSVAVANGDRVKCVGCCNNVTLSINEEAFGIDLFAIPLDAFELILGVHWLRTLGPIVWDFELLSMSLWRLDHQVIWHGLAAPGKIQANCIMGDDMMSAVQHEFAELFEPPRGLPPVRRQDHRIHLKPGTEAVVVRPYRYPQLQKDEIEKQCEDMLAQGIIRNSTSAFSSPVLLVKKHDASWRFCVDYRALNEQTIKDKFPIPVVDELLDELTGSKFFTKLDLRSGYHQVRMCPHDVEKTAFRTHHGHFEFLVMAFGLTNASATFQSLMNEVLKPFLRKFVLVFFNDILIYSTSWAEHLQHVRAVFQLLRHHQLALKRSKCSFGMMSVAYLVTLYQAKG